MKKNIKIKQNKGITLISLVITIIVLLILTGITLSSISSKSGIMATSSESKFKANVQEINERLILDISQKKIDNIAFDSITLNGNLENILGKHELYNQYSNKLFVYRGKLVYIGSKSQEQEWAQELGLKIFNMESDEDRLALHISVDKNTAIANNQITKNQYTYRITGDLKTRIQEKLGRKIDYSIDRFYEVKYQNILSDIDEGKTFIYSDYSGIVIEVLEQTEKNVATWFWNGTSELDVAILEQKTSQNEFFEKLENYNISQIYISQRFDRLLGNTKIENFVANAYSRDIKVYIVTGNINYLDDDIKDGTIYTLYNTLEKYNQSVAYNKRIAGISYDAEFWLNSEYNWKNNETIRNDHIQYIKDIKEYSQIKNLEATFTLPFWIVQYNYTDNNGNTINMFEEITKTLEEVNLLIYRDTSEKIDALISNVQSNAEKTLREYCLENECILNIGVETAPSEEGDNVTFYEEETENQGYVIQELKKLQSLYSPDWQNFSFSIHHSSQLMEILGGIQIDNIIEISSAFDLADFLTKTDDGIGKVFNITCDIDMKNYTVSSYNNSEDGFNGILNGNNYTIENLNIDSTELTGLFKKVGTNGIVKNLNIKNSTITTTSYYAGAITGLNYGTIINCSNQNTTVNGKQYVGGLIGRNYGTIKNSFNTGNITCQAYFVGGITGKNESSANIYNVYSTGTITEKGADGSLGAITAQNVGTIQKAYWLEGSSPKAIGYTSEGETIPMKSEEMMSANFIQTLNNNISSYTDLETWTLDKIGEEYPHF